MDWRIVLKTCSGLNASWALELALRAMVSPSPDQVGQTLPLAEAANVRDCRPYILSPGPKVPMYSFLRKVVPERVNGFMRTVKILDSRLNVMRKASDIQVNYLSC